MQPITQAYYYILLMCLIRKFQPKEKKSPLKFLVRVTSFKTKAHFDTETLDTSRRGQAGLLEPFL